MEDVVGEGHVSVQQYDKKGCIDRRPAQNLRISGKPFMLDKRSGLEETIKDGCHRLYGEERGYLGAENAYF